MSILEIKNLSHMFDSKPLFEGANVTVNNGEHIGVVGLNGAGKSTFINIIAGKIIQDSGEIKWNNNIKRGYLDQYALIERNCSVMDYLKGSFDHLFELNEKMESLYNQMADKSGDELEKLINKANNILDRLTSEGFFDIEAQIKKVANGLGVGNFGFDTQISNLSGGQRAKLLLTKLLLEQPDMMMLDEPTNFLDIEHIDWLVNFLNSLDKTFLVISHDTDFLNKICKYIIAIENGQIKKYGGNFDQYKAQAEQNAKQYSESFVRQQREIEKLEDYIARNKARAATAGMANSRQKMLDKMEIIKKPSVIYDAEFSFPHTPLHTRDLLAVKDLLIGYGAPLLPAINLHLSSESKVWIRGTNGIGKTTFIKTIMGKLKPIGGEFKFHLAANCGYLEQDFNISIFDKNAVTYFNDLYPRMNIKSVRAALAGVGIKNELALKPVSDLSGGEKVRIFLCSLMQEKTNVLVLDEPTNHLDVRAKDALMEALKAYKGAIILVSHEREFAESICNQIFDCR